MSEDQQKQNGETESEVVVTSPVEEAAIDVPEKVTPSQQKKARSVSTGMSFVNKFILLIVALISIAALGTNYVLWEQLGKNSESVDGKIESRVKHQIELISQTQNKQFELMDIAIRKNRSDSQQFLNLLQTMQVQLEQQAKSDIKLIHAESVLRLAKNQYEILHDRDTTMMALKLASDLLGEFSQPQIAVIRNLVLTELQSIKNMSVPNLSAELIKLELLINDSSQLQLITAIAEEAVDSDKLARKENKKKTWSETFKGILKSLQPLVTVRRHQGATVAMLSIEEEKLVRTILKSRYEYIRQAMLHRNDVLLKNSVSAAQQWIKRYFDAEKTSVKDALEQLEQISNIKMQVDYPPVGYALQQLVKYRSQEKSQDTP